MGTQWLAWAKRLQALAQSGLTFTDNPLEIERYQAVRQIAAEMMAAGSDTPIERIIDLFSREVGYATPKVDVRGVIFRDEKILLVRERFDGLWTLPGGWADVGDTPSEAVIKEIREESGFEARAVKLLAAYDQTRHRNASPFPFHIHKLIFLCEIVGGIEATSIETDEVAFLTEDSIPTLSLGRITPSQIARIYDPYRNPDWPTDFD